MPKHPMTITNRHKVLIWRIWEIWPEEKRVLVVFLRLTSEMPRLTFKRHLRDDFW
jgi:hypothetical protein